MAITKFYGKLGPKHRPSLRQEHPQMALNIVILNQESGCESTLLPFRRDLRAALLYKSYLLYHILQNVREFSL